MGGGGEIGRETESARERERESERTSKLIMCNKVV